MDSPFQFRTALLIFLALGNSPTGFATSVSLDKASLAQDIPLETVKLIEPQEKRELTMRALPLGPVLDKLYGSKWRELKQIQFVCTDGYRPQVLVSRIRKGKPYLATEIEGRPKFQVEKDGKTIDVGPLYLIWTDSLTDGARYQSLHAGEWPYQIDHLEVK